MSAELRQVYSPCSVVTISAPIELICLFFCCCFVLIRSSSAEGARRDSLHSGRRLSPAGKVRRSQIGLRGARTFKRQLSVSHFCLQLQTFEDLLKCQQLSPEEQRMVRSQAVKERERTKRPIFLPLSSGARPAFRRSPFFREQLLVGEGRAQTAAERGPKRAF